MLVALLGACSSHGGDSASDAARAECETAAPTAVVGTGEYAWEPLEPGNEITMVHGPQGGWHILGSVRIDAMYENVEIRYTMPLGEIVFDCTKINRFVFSSTLRRRSARRVPEGQTSFAAALGDCD